MISNYVFSSLFVQLFGVVAPQEWKKALKYSGKEQ
jgi:hypothetical protein